MAAYFSPETLPNWGLVIVGTFATVAAVKNLYKMQRQISLLEKQISIPYRAYLSVGKPSFHGEELWIDVRNTGMVPGQILSIGIEIIVQSLSGVEMYRRDIEIPWEEIVPPRNHKSTGIRIMLPHEAMIGDQVLIYGKITYKTGFSETDILEFVRVYMRHQKRWATASETVEFNFLSDAKAAKDEHQQ